ncbi:MAG TPA: serine/threonine-protein kinase, partial [Kofleriaceae bacterium]
MSTDGNPASGSMSMETPSLVGQVLGGRYRLVKKLGEGGMGEVYAAEHVHIEKKFALKLLRPEIVSNKEAVQRFYQEARSSSSIGHRNIIGIEDFGDLPDGRLYMCMELLNGLPLNDLIKQPQPNERLLNIIIQTGHGLAAAHAKGIIHRDMKPENIFVTIGPNNEDVPKLLDFGIAKVAGNDGQNNLTRTGTIFGTPFYMAPEQALGNHIDARTDIYAVGVIMYELFAGSLPFQGESFMGILTQHITTEPENVEQRAAKAGRTLPPGLAPIIQRCMSKDPNQRPQTMDELVNLLVPIYRIIAGAGMSTYMEAFPVTASSSHPIATPPQGYGAKSPTMGVGAPPGAMQQTPAGGMQPGGMQQQGMQPGGWQQPPVSGQIGQVPSASSSGVYAGDSVVAPKKSSAGLIIAIILVLLAGGGVAAFMVLGKKDTGTGTGSGSGTTQSGIGSSNSTPDAAQVASTTPDAAVVTPNTPADAAAAATTPDAPEKTVADAAVVEPAAADAAVVEPTPVDAAPAEPDSVKVTLVGSSNESIEIWEDGKLVSSDGIIDVPKGGKRSVVVKAKGYKDKPMVVTDKKLSLSVTLPKISTTIPTNPPNGPKCSGTKEDIKDPKCRPAYCRAHPEDVRCDAE